MLRTAVLGCGLIATHKFLPILRRLRRDVTVVGLCDRDGEALARAMAQFPGTRGDVDLQALLETERPELVVVCTPPASHTGVATACLTAGAPVLGEKTMAVG